MTGEEAEESHALMHASVSSFLYLFSYFRSFQFEQLVTDSPIQHGLLLATMEFFDYSLNPR